MDFLPALVFIVIAVPSVNRSLSIVNLVSTGICELPAVLTKFYIPWEFLIPEADFKSSGRSSLNTDWYSTSHIQENTKHSCCLKGQLDLSEDKKLEFNKKLRKVFLGTG